MNPREELIKRVTVAMADFRNEMLAAGVQPEELAEQVTVTETADGVSVSFFAASGEKPKRKKDE